MEQKLIRSDKPFIPSPFASILPQSSSFPWKLHSPLIALLSDWKCSTNMEAPQYPEFTVYLQVL